MNKAKATLEQMNFDEFDSYLQHLTKTYQKKYGRKFGDDHPELLLELTMMLLDKTTRPDSGFKVIETGYVPNHTDEHIMRSHREYLEDIRSQSCSS